MKPATYQTLEAWQVQRARTARLNREEVPVPLWVLWLGTLEKLAVVAAAEMLALAWAAGVFK